MHTIIALGLTTYRGSFTPLPLNLNCNVNCNSTVNKEQHTIFHNNQITLYEIPK